MVRRLRTPRLLPVTLVVLGASALLASCGEDRSSTAVSASGGSPTTAAAPEPTSPPTTGTDGAADEASGSTSGSGGGDEQPTTTVDAAGAVGRAEAQVAAAVSAWADAITGVSISPGEELIVSISTDDEALPALEVCEAARGGLVGVDGAAGATVNVWLTPDLTADGGDERVLAGSLGGAECELVRAAE